MRGAGVEGPQACPRGLRHSFGVAAVTTDLPLSTIAAVLGHASLSTIAIYTTAIGAEARELASRVWTEDPDRDEEARHGRIQERGARAPCAQPRARGQTSCAVSCMKSHPRGASPAACTTEDPAVNS